MDDWLLQWNAVVDGRRHHETMCLCSFREPVYYRHILQYPLCPDVIRMQNLKVYPL